MRFCTGNVVLEKTLECLVGVIFFKFDEVVYISYSINRNVNMPELSRFFGIIIRMFMESGIEHHTPHFHVYYQDEIAVFSVNPVEMIEGSLPRRQKRLTEAWGEMHQQELEKDWELLQMGQLPKPIEPLQ